MFLRKKKNAKRICHVGAWAGNFGDSIIQQSIRHHLLSLAQYDLKISYLNCQKIEFTKELIDDLNNSADLLLVGGGGLIFYRPQDNSLSGWQWNIDIDLIDKIKIPFVVYGVGYNQFEYDNSNFLPVTNRHLEKTVQKAAIFSVRNNGTKRELARRGCCGDNIIVIPDSGMFIKPKKLTIPGLKKNKLKIGFNWTSDREEQTFPEPFPESRSGFINNCVDLLNFLIKKKNAQIFYIGHMSGEFDAEIIKILKERLVEEPVIIDHVLEHIYPPVAERAGYLVDVYRQMDVVIGMRGHANIVSFGQLTPFAGLGTHGKIRYFLEDISREKYFLDARPESRTTLDCMKNIVDDLVDNNSFHRRILKDKFIIQKKIFFEMNKNVLNLLRQN